jgi:hydrogenase-4 component E
VLQLLNSLAALLLLLSFAMLAQRRVVTLVNLLALQGAILCAATLLLAWRTGERNLYVSAALTLGLKVVFLPWLLHRLIRRLGVYWDTDTLLNIPGTMLIGLGSSCSPSAWRSRSRRSRAPRRAARSASRSR